MIELSKDLFSNNNLIDNLVDRFFSKNFSQSLIFSGQQGVGKTTSAFYLISKIYQKIESKNNNINLIFNNTHPNIRYISKLFDEKSNKLKKNISIDQIRVLDSFLNQSTFDNLPKFIIIDSTEDLNNSSANSLLKSLEEPKKNTFFILITHQISLLLPTIRSRCLNYFFVKPTYDQFLTIIKKNNNLINISDLNFLYYLSDGSPGLALKIYSENLFNIYDIIIKILIEKESLTPDIINLANITKDYSNDEFKNFIILLKFISISIIKINLGYNFHDSTSSKLIENLSNIAKLIPNSTSMKILKFLGENERDLFIYNLDKKIFCVNIFSSLNEYE